MSIDKITSKILDEATEVKELTLSEAQVRCDEILTDAREKAEEVVRNMEARGQEEKERIVERRKSVAFIDSRKVLLNKKQEIIGECFDEAIDAIIGLDRKEYLDLLISLGKASGITSGVLIFNEKEGKDIGPEIAGKLGEFTLADKAGDMKGGYIIQSGQTFVDNTIESLVQEYKTKLSATASGMLFPEK